MKKNIATLLFLLTVGLFEPSGETGTDSTGMDRGHASRHYTKRCKLTIRGLKITLLVDTRTLAILAVHITTTRKHDSKIILPVIRWARKNGVKIKVNAADMGYDDRKVREALRREGIRPVIPHREFTGRQKAWNSRIKKKDYNRRVLCESVNSSVKRRYRDHVSSRYWWSQFKEVILMACVYNIDRSLSFLIVFLAFKHGFWGRVATKLNTPKNQVTFTLQLNILFVFTKFWREII
jgi:IS5 family transposase